MRPGPRVNDAAHNDHAGRAACQISGKARFRQAPAVQIARATNLPTLTDVDTGVGEPPTRSPMMLQHRGDMELK
jgi:hypothetical protein